MNREDWVQLGVLAIAAVGLPLVVAIPLKLSIWVVAAIIGVLLAAVAVRAVQLRNRGVEQWRALQPVAAPPPPAPARPVEYQLSGMPVASADQDYRFLLAARVFWRQVPKTAGWPNANPSALAMESILERAWEVTVQLDPQDCQLAQCRLAASLGVAARDKSGQVEAWAVDVALSLTADDQQRLAKLAELRKNEQLREEERVAERSARSYIAEDALATPSSAIVWWLARHPDQVDEAVRLREPLARLCAAVRQHEPATADWERPWVFPSHADGHVLAAVPDHQESPRNIATNLVHRLFPRTDEGPRRARFAEQLANLVSSHGRQDLADEIRADQGRSAIETTESEDQSA